LRYINFVFAALMACYTNLLPTYTIRYAFFYQPLLILSACAVIFEFSKCLTGLFEQTVPTIPHRCLRWLTAGCAGVLLLSSNGSTLQLYRINENGDIAFFFRYGEGFLDYRGITKFVQEQIRPGDLIVGGQPHTYAYYSGEKADYGLNTLLSKRMFYNMTLTPPIFIDRYSGSPNLRNSQELRDAVYRAKRVWFLGMPYPTVEQMGEGLVTDFIMNQSRLVFQDSLVKAYLWEGGRCNLPVDVLSTINPSMTTSTDNSSDAANVGSNVNSNDTSPSSNYSGSKQQLEFMPKN
jgi:hypothetical protein